MADGQGLDVNVGPVELTWPSKSQELRTIVSEQQIKPLVRCKSQVLEGDMIEFGFETAASPPLSGRPLPLRPLRVLPRSQWNLGLPFHS